MRLLILCVCLSAALYFMVDHNTSVARADSWQSATCRSGKPPAVRQRKQSRNPIAPVLSRVDPKSGVYTEDGTPGGEFRNYDMDITVYGEHFVRSAKVCIDGTTVKTVFVSSHRLKAHIPHLLLHPGDKTAQITVLNKSSHKVSNPIAFKVGRLVLGG